MDIPKLCTDTMRRIGTTKTESVICGKDLTKAQAAEVIRRAEAHEAHEGLEEAVSNLRERMETITDLSGVYASLLGTEKECPWVRAMMSINGQSRTGLKETKQALGEQK